MSACLCLAVWNNCFLANFAGHKPAKTKMLLPPGLNFYSPAKTMMLLCAELQTSNINFVYIKVGTNKGLSSIIAFSCPADVLEFIADKRHRSIETCLFKQLELM